MLDLSPVLGDREIDIDRLHAAIEGKYRHVRRAGNSFGFLVLMVHEVMQGDPGNRYLYIGENQNFVDLFVMRPLREILVLEGFNIELIKTRRTIYVKDTDMTFMFGYPWNGMSCKYKGYMFSRTFVDLTPSSEREYLDDLYELQLRTEEYRYG